MDEDMTPRTMTQKDLWLEAIDESIERWSTKNYPLYPCALCHAAHYNSCKNCLVKHIFGVTCDGADAPIAFIMTRNRADHVLLSLFLMREIVENAKEDLLDILEVSDD
jgi:hypothetical protein